MNKAHPTISGIIRTARRSVALIAKDGGGDGTDVVSGGIAKFQRG
jgi:hypothetical protein